MKVQYFKRALIEIEFDKKTYIVQHHSGEFVGVNWAEGGALSDDQITLIKTHFPKIIIGKGMKSSFGGCIDSVTTFAFTPEDECWIKLIAKDSSY